MAFDKTPCGSSSLRVYAGKSERTILERANTRADYRRRRFKCGALLRVLSMGFAEYAVIGFVVWLAAGAVATWIFGKVARGE